jgi:hypothetical protein
VTLLVASGAPREPAPIEQSRPAPNERRATGPGTWLLVLTICLVSFLTYRAVLGDFFTGGDTIMHIDQARIASWADVARLVTRPLGAGSEAAEQWMFYRPLAALSYSADYALWALTPFGFHLTDVLLHTLVAVLVFFVARALCDGSRVAAWLAAILFTSHPILVETVPATARRHDPLAGVFILLSLLAFLDYRSRRPRRAAMLVLSVAAYVLALLSKEPAIILPVLIVALALLVPEDQATGTSRTSLRSAIAVAMPYLLASVAVLAWRTYVLRGVGGRMAGSHDNLPTLIGAPANYVLDLLYPISVLASAISPNPGLVPHLLFAGTALLGVAALLIARRRLSRALGAVAGPGAGQALRILVGALALVAVLSLLAILTYPLVTSHINDIIRRAHSGEAFQRIGRAMSDRHVYPAELYIFKIRDLLLTNLFAGLVLSALAAWAIAARERLGRFLSTRSGRVALFLLVWTLLPLGLHLATGVFAHRHMYLPAVPFSILVALLLVESVRGARGPAASPARRREAVAVAGLAASVCFFSPLVWAYREWHDSGRIAEMVLEALTEGLPEWPAGSVVHITALPTALTDYDTAVPRVKSVTYLTHYSIKSWLDLQHPDNRVHVAVLTKARLAAVPRAIEVRPIARQGNLTILAVTSHAAAEGTTRR